MIKEKFRLGETYSLKGKHNLNIYLPVHKPKNKYLLTKIICILLLHLVSRICVIIQNVSIPWTILNQKDKYSTNYAGNTL